MQAVRHQAGLYDASDSAVLKVQGLDAPKFLQSLTTNDVVSLPTGQLQYAALLDRKGKVLALFSIIRADETAFLILVQSDLNEFLAEHLNKMRFIQEVTISDESDKWAWLWVAGPEALQIVGDAFGIHGDMLVMENRILIPSDRSAWHVWRNDRWSVPAVFLLLPRAQVGEAIDCLGAAGATKVNKLAIDRVRLEAGIPECGPEINAEHILMEADLTDSFARNKGCYPGQEVIERISAYGAGKTPYKFMTSIVSSDLTLEAGMAVESADGEAVSRVVRSIFDPAAKNYLIAYYLPRSHVAETNTLNVVDGHIRLS